MNSNKPVRALELTMSRLTKFEGDALVEVGQLGHVAKVALQRSAVVAPRNWL
jgi:hypothetical protein